ncbi:hypothetical protein QQ045_000345 [Rhodiola kirilowii]
MSSLWLLWLPLLLILTTGFLWPLYLVAEGTMFWALLVLEHDCGHGSFSDSPTLNSVLGHALHSFILVPYHGCDSEGASFGLIHNATTNPQELSKCAFTFPSECSLS